MRKRTLGLLPVLSTLLGCAVALPQEDLQSAAPSLVEEPTPAPFQQAKITPTFHLPDTPTPLLTPTPTKGSQTSTEPTGANVIVYWQQDPERQVLYPTNVDQFGRALSKSFAIESSANYKVLRPDHRGGSLSLYDRQFLAVHPSPNIHY